MNDAQNPRLFGPGDTVAGKLRIIRRLGEGGMGAVFEVEHELTHHRRALKLLHAEMASMPSVVERFLREASAAGRIGNPHIVETFDAGLLETGEPYIVMELLQGKSLAEMLQESGPFELSRACNVLIQACGAIQAAHAVGIIHRDLKPENLFLSEPAYTFVKILDFGISKFDEVKTGVEGLTMEGSPIGTPYYMSPEQIRGEKDVDGRTDVYALGVVLYECVTGARPFESDNLLQLIHLVSQGLYKAPTQVRSGLPKEVDEVVAKAIALDRVHRYANANDFSEALHELREAVSRASLDATAPLVTERPPMIERGTLAMTPEPMSRTVDVVKASAWPHRSTLRWLVSIGATILVLVGLAIAFGRSLVRSNGGVPTTVPPTGIPTTTTDTSATTRSTVVPALVVAANAYASASTSAEAGTPEAASVSPSRRKDVPLATGKRSTVAPSATRRADSYGLSKDNPFK